MVDCPNHCPAKALGGVGTSWVFFKNRNFPVLLCLHHMKTQKHIKELNNAMLKQCICYKLAVEKSSLWKEFVLKVSFQLLKMWFTHERKTIMHLKTYIFQNTCVHVDRAWMSKHTDTCCSMHHSQWNTYAFTLCQSKRFGAKSRSALVVYY